MKLEGVLLRKIVFKNGVKRESLLIKLIWNKFLTDVVLATLCGTSPTRIDTFGNVASLIFKSDNIQQPNFNGFIVRVNARVEGNHV